MTGERFEARGGMRIPRAPLLTHATHGLDHLLGLFRNCQVPSFRGRLFCGALSRW